MNLKEGIAFVLLFNVCVSALPKGNRVTINSAMGKYIWGLNYPWRQLGTDFGNNGVVSNLNDINSEFQDMHQDKTAKVVRWWLFPYGGGIIWDSTGYATGLSSQVFDNMDSALKIVESNDIYLVFTLFSYQFACPLDWNSDGDYGGGHGNAIVNDTLADGVGWNVFYPILQRYGNNSRILAWEVMNEPEHILTDLPDGSTSICKGSPVNILSFYRFTRKLADILHEYSNQYITVGSDSLKYYRIYTPAFSQQWSKAHNYQNMPTDMGLDFYQTHHYVWENGQSWNDNEWFGPGTIVYWSPEDQNYYDLPDIDKPIFVGEVECKPDGTSSCIDRLNTMFNNGYAGVLPWSYNGDNCDGISGCDGYNLNYLNITQWYWENSEKSMLQY